ncbi:MAG: hypothetical protein JWP55_846 [Mycobacterium sp.]|nr:hypothetical protein [Mycobacterium sp.]
MKKLRLIAAVVIAGAFTMLSTGAAQAYAPDDVNVIITIPDATLIGGNTVHFSATTDAPDLQCNWTVKLANGVAAGVSDTLTGSGTSFSGSFKTKVVSATQKHPLSATCNYDDGHEATSSTSPARSHAVIPAVYVVNTGSTLQAVAQTVSASATVTLLPLSGDDTGALPNTGGSHLWVLVLGGVLLVGGGGLVLATRRRSTHH